MDNEMINQSVVSGDELSQPLSNIEIDTIGEILNISMGSAATAVSTFLDKQVNITTPTVTVVNFSELEFMGLEPAMGIEIEYIEGLNGANYFIMKVKDIRAIVNLLIPAEDDDSSDSDELDEMHLSAMSEIMNQMMGASSTAMASFFGKIVNISTPKHFDPKLIIEREPSFNEGAVVAIRFMFEVEGIFNSQFLTVMPITFAKELVVNALGDMENSAPEIARDSLVASVIPTAQQTVEQTVQKTAHEAEQKAEQTISPQPQQSVKNIEKKPNKNISSGQVSVKPLELQNFDFETENLVEGIEVNQDNFNLIQNVPLDVSVEVGRTKMMVKNILEIRQGSIVELDRQAGDPVDVIVNGQLVAKGDVVVIDDNFGVRITQILL